MCQAYDAEFRFICWSEDRACVVGFFAALDGKSTDSNPYKLPFEMYKYEAWIHGFNCASRKGTGGEYLLPWAIEKQIGYAMRDKVRDRFKRTGKLPKGLREKLS